jgi:hypothetical protein
LHEEAQATIKRLTALDPGLKNVLKKAHGYVVFPAVGKAAAVIGGAYGHGEVYEKGKPIGYATIAQLTIGVQLGGDTFSELIVFENRQPLERFKQGKLKFAANASAVLVKAGAAATTNFEKGAKTFVYSEGGMLLELGLGGQKFKFKPEGEASGGKAKGSSQSDEEEEDQDEDSEEEGDESDEGSGALGMASKAVGMVKEHPVMSALIGAGIAAGAYFAVSRFMQSGSDEGSEEGEEDDEQEEDDDEGAQGSSQRDEDEDEDESEDDEDEESDDEEDDEETEAKGSKDDEEDEEEDEDEDEEDEEDDEDEDKEEESASSSRRGKSRW